MQEKTKDINLEKKQVKLSLFIDDVLCTKKTQKDFQIILELLSKFSKVNI